MDNIKVVNRLKELRNEKHLTQEQLSQTLSVSQANISKYENGHIDFRTGTLEMLANFYGVSIDYILIRTNNRQEVLNPPASEVINNIIERSMKEPQAIKYLAELYNVPENVLTQQLKLLQAMFHSKN
jgi:transcriptional regulator with XRE-family HTH domain